MLGKEIISRLREIVGKEAVLTAKEDLVTYSYDGTTTWTHMPDVVVLPTTTEQVSHILKLASCNRRRLLTRGKPASAALRTASLPSTGG